MSLANDSSKLAGELFRIGHLAHFNDLMLMGTLDGVETGLSLAGIIFSKGRSQTALQILLDRQYVVIDIDYIFAYNKGIGS